MDLVARQSVGAAERGDPFTQGTLDLLQPLVLVAVFGKADEELLDERRHRGAPLGRDDPGMAISLIVQ